MDNKTVNDASREPFSFIDALGMLRGRLKLIICLSLIAALLGAAAGATFSFFGREYRAQVKFYLSPGANTPTLLQLLKSEAFAEELLLDENRLPENWDKTDADYIAALEAVNAEREIRDRYIEICKKQETFNYYVSPSSDKAYERVSYNEIKNKYEALVAEYDRIYDLLAVYKTTYSDKVAEQPSHQEKTLEYEAALETAETERNEYKKNFFDPKEADRIRLNDEYIICKAELKEARISSDDAVERLLKKWRENNESRSFVSAVQSYVTYQYATVVDKEIIKDPENLEDVKENQNYSFLEISVNAGSDERSAELIVEKLKEKAPAFIISNLEKLTGTSEARCILISAYAQPRSGGAADIVKGAVIYSAVACLAAAAITCFVMITKGILSAELEQNKRK